MVSVNSRVYLEIPRTLRHPINCLHNETIVPLLDAGCPLRISVKDLYNSRQKCYINC